jgi:hypothetical protein
MTLVRMQEKCELQLAPSAVHPSGRAREVSIEEAGDAGRIADRVRQGKALLKVVVMPWGVEFYLDEEVET